MLSVRGAAPCLSLVSLRTRMRHVQIEVKKRISAFFVSFLGPLLEGTYHLRFLIFDLKIGKPKSVVLAPNQEGIAFLLPHRVLCLLFSYRQNRDAKEKEENPSEDEMKETWDKEKRKEPIEGKEISGEKEGSVEGNEVKRADEVATEQNSEQGIKGEEGVSEEEGKAKDIDVASKEGGKETTKTEQGLDEEWKNKVDEAILKLRSTLKEKLNKLGVKPEGESWQILVI